MKQILQNLGSGETELAEVPVPMVRAGCLLIRTAASLVSLGTERMLVDFGKANLVQKARQQPEKVRQVLDKVRTDGLMPTLNAVRSKLDQPLPLGYCNAGTVVAVGEGVEGFTIGDRVVSNGPHAEYVCVAKNLCAHIPDGVSFDDAAFTVAASIALQGIRLLNPTLGERVVVIGLGLIGQLAVQLLRANGVQVLGADLDPDKCSLATSSGAQVVHAAEQSLSMAAAAFSGGRGVDGVLLTASTSSSQPVNEAASICRVRGRVIQVGATGLELDRKPFYEREVTFQVSCSYGPGRYDEDYEQRGIDYPFGYVRWTEQRNFEAVLQLMAVGAVNPAKLVSHRYPIGDAIRAYSGLGSAGTMGILLNYPEGTASAVSERVVQVAPRQPSAVSKTVVGVIGAGNYAGQVLLPALRATGVRLRTLVSSGGVTGTHNARKFGFEQTATDLSAVFDDPEVNLVVISTRHDTHAPFAIRALEGGKAVFVEKPLCLTLDELSQIESAYAAAKQPFLMVGFNRRFAPLIVRVRKLVEDVSEPKAVVITVNAGVIPGDSWVHDPRSGGGRLIGEACHFMDLARFIIGHPIAHLHALQMGAHPAVAVENDKVIISLRFEDGSIASIQYLGNGSKSFPKERVEVFAGGAVLQLDNYRTLRGFGWRRFSKDRGRGQDKGHASEMAAVVRALETGGDQPVPFKEIVEVSRWTILAAQIAAGKSAPTAAPDTA